MAINTNNNSYTIVYATIVVVIVAFLLSFVSKVLEPQSLANERIDKKKQILASLNIRNLSKDSVETYYQRVIKTPVKLLGDGLFDFIETPPCKVICIELHDHEKQERFRHAAEEKFADKLDIMYSNPYYLELIPKESGKGEALKRLCEFLEIPVENSIAAGDGDNDISMIEAAGVGVAMLNAPETVRTVADVVTRFDNDHDGLAEIIRNKGKI